MNERSAKTAVVVIGVLLTLGVIVWRTASALRASAQGITPAAGWSFEVLSEHPAPESYRAPDCYGLPSVEGLAAEQLAVVDFKGTRKSIDHSAQAETDFLPIRNKERELGANVSVKESTVDLPDDPGMAKLHVSLWLLHSGPLPKALAPGRHQLVCVITDVDASGLAWVGGLRPGDVWTEVEATNALAPPSADPCRDLATASKATPVGTDVHFVVYRHGQRQELTVHKTAPLLNFGSISAPVLDADRT